MPDEPCPLCNLTKQTHWYEETDEYIVCDCITCDVPMVVAKVHGSEVDDTPELKQRCLKALRRVADEKYGKLKWKWCAIRSLPEHWHQHAVPIGGK